MSYDNDGESDAPFNMAVATLMRLDGILKQITKLDYNEGENVEKQRSYMNLVKQFFINAIPLLKEETVNQKKDAIINFSMDTTARVKSGNQKKIEVYNPKKNEELNLILIELQQELKKYFMPKGQDLSKAVHF